MLQYNWIIPENGISVEPLACYAKTDDGWIIVYGDGQKAPYDELWPPHFADEGTKLRLGARTEREP